MKLVELQNVIGTLGIVLAHLSHSIDRFSIGKCLLYGLSAKLNVDSRSSNSSQCF